VDFPVVAAGAFFVAGFFGAGAGGEAGVGAVWAAASVVRKSAKTSQ
jgi:hypothetical protein